MNKTEKNTQEQNINDEEMMNKTKGNKEIKQMEENNIENKLMNPNIKNQVSLREFLKNIRFQIQNYERNYGISKENIEKMKIWQSRIFRIIKEYKDVSTEINETSREGLEMLKLMNRQLQQSETNQRLLEKTTLKLIGLDYSCDDIKKAMYETKTKMDQTKTTSKKEKKRIFYAFLFFVLVCFYIIIDKIKIRFF